MAILNLLGAKAHLNASHAGAHYRCSLRTPFLARDGHFSEYATNRELLRLERFIRGRRADEAIPPHPCDP